MSARVRCLAVAFAMTATACSSPAGTPAGTASTAEAPAPAAALLPSETGIAVSSARQQQWGVVLGRAEMASGPAVITLPGVLRFDDTRTAHVNSLVPGQVVSLAVDLGTAVRRGQVLATIHAPDVSQAKAAFLQAAAKAELASREHERGRVLFQQEAIDQKDLLRRRADAEHAASDVGAAESRLHSLGFDQAAVDALLDRARRDESRGRHEDLTEPYLHLTAPVAGRVIERQVLAGQHVNPDKLLFVIADLSTVWALLDAREGDLPSLSVGRPVRVRTSVYPARAWDGLITYVGDVVDERSRTVKVRVAIRNDGFLLKPNMFVQGEVADLANQARDVLSVPEDAVQTVNGDTVVFVRLASGRFVATPVEVAERRGGRRAVLRGLTGSESVVVAGAFSLKAELLKSSLSGE
jgi:cobalt-zinc-cadmium efflux system membrane fusion protein